MSLRAQLLLGLGLILVFVVAVSGLAYRTVLIDREAADWVGHTEDVLSLANQATMTTDDLELRFLQFLLTGSPDALAAYQSDSARVANQLAQLSELTADNPPQAQRWQAIAAELDRVRAEVTDPAIAARAQAPPAAPDAATTTTAGPTTTAETTAATTAATEAAEQRAFANVRAAFAAAIGVERQLLDQRTQAADAANVFLERVLIWGTGTATAVWLVVSLMLSRRVAHTIQRFTAALERELAALASLQHRTETILNSTAEGIYGIDQHGACTIVNPSTARLTGYALEELRGARIHDLIHHTRPDGTPYPREQCPAITALREARAIDVRNECFWRKDGSSFPVEYSVVPVTEDDHVTGAVLSFRDVTERRNVERMKDEFVSVVSHELRTPLTSIRGSLGLLAAGLLGPISERASRMVDVAVSNTDRLIRLINDILDIERIESGHAPMEKHWTDVRELVLRSVETVRPMAEKAELQVVVDAEPILMRADPDRLQQTLTNLLGNAIKFSPPSTTVEVGARREDDHALISVRDRGRGIPADKLETIFGRFEQVDASDAREKGGSGLGLAIARSIVEQHGGRIWVESTLGQGSTFFLTIPLSDHGPGPLNGERSDQPPEGATRFGVAC